MDEERIDRLVAKTGGPFRLTALIQKRMVELYRGGLPMAPVKKYLMDTVLDEIEHDKIKLIPPPGSSHLVLSEGEQKES